MSAPSVWAIVLMYGGEEVTAACLESLLAQDYPNLTVLLVDNASPDGSGERLRARFPRVQYLNTGANLGYTGGNNVGAGHALDRGAEYLLVINNDTVVEPTCVSNLLNSARSLPRLGAIVPKILYYDDPTRVWYAGGDLLRSRAMARHRRERQRDDPGEAARIEPITFVTGCCLLLPAEVVRALGESLFAEDFFMYAEDIDLSVRLLDAGYRLYYQPAARVLHHEPARAPYPTPFQIRLLGRNRRRIARRRLGRGERALFAAFFYPTRVLRMIEYTLRGDWARARAVLAAVTEP